LPGKSKKGRVQSMKHALGSVSRRYLVAGSLSLFLAVAARIGAEPTQEATTAYNSYVNQVEARLAQKHPTTCVSLPAGADLARLRNGELVVEQVSPEMNEKLPGAQLYDWRGTAFVAGARPEDFVRLMKAYDAYPQTFAPEMLGAHVVTHEGDHYQVIMRVRQKHILTAVLDITYDVAFGRGGSGGDSSGGTLGQCGFVDSRSTKIAEIDQASTSQERALAPNEDHGYLWRQNNYWSYEVRDGGLYIQIESISLSRSIPAGLGWAIGSFTKSIPRETMEFTLRCMRDALRKSG